MAAAKESAVHLAEIEQIVRRGAMYLAEALLDYWPAAGNNEICERNITLHLARSFAEREYRTYAEGHSNNTVGQRVDLLALHPARGIQVAVEAKRLYSAEKLDEMRQDADRVAEFRAAEFPARHRYGVIVATTWNDKYAAWWASNDADEPGKKTEGWAEFEKHRFAGKEESLWGCCVLRGFEELKSQETPWHYLLYSVFEVA